MIVKQIILGNIPEHLKHCVASVMQWCSDRSVSYEQITNADRYGAPPSDERQKYLWYRNVSEHIKIDILSTEPRVLVVDWDCYFYPDFTLDETEPHVYHLPLECMVYNGDDLQSFCRVRELMPVDVKGGRLDLMTALILFQQKRGKSFPVFDRSKAIHFCNFQLLAMTQTKDLQ